MKRALYIAILFLLAIPAFSQTNTDRDLVEKALSGQPQQHRKDTHAVYHLLRHQLRGQCYYAPECVDFFPQAVKDLGPVRGTLSMLDRMMRDTYIGTATFPAALKGKDGRIHEGTQAYRRRRKGR